MPPTVEQGIKQAYDRSYFSVDLNGPDEFDVELFNQQLREVAVRRDRDSPTSSTGQVKFMVLDPEMLIFNTSARHSDIYDCVRRVSKNSGELVCAGHIDFNLLGAGEDPINRGGVVLNSGEMLISGYSATLVGSLGPNSSEDYKRNILSKRLPGLFKFK